MFAKRTTTLRGTVALGAALLLVTGLALVLAACSADSPSEPSQPEGTSPEPQNAVWNIEVDLGVDEVPAGGETTVPVRVTVTNRNNGQPPANGTTVVMAASAGGFSANVIQLNNGRGATNFIPPTDQVTSSVTIQARLEGDVGQAVLRLLEPAAFFIGSVDPRSGSPNGGDRVAIVGGGFERPTRVTFGGVPAQVISVGTGRILVETPPSPNPVAAGSTLSVDVSVTINLNEEGQASDTLASGFTFAHGGTVPLQPAVTSVTPAGGPNEGGTRVTINGDGFQSPVQVFFGSGSSAQSFTGVEASVESVTPNRIVVVTPAATGFGQNNLNQVVDILVKNLSSGLGTVATSAFQYGAGGAGVPFVSSISPSQGPYTGGTLVTVYGQGFDEPVAVEMGSVGQQVVSVTGTEIVIRTVAVDVPSCADVTGPTRVVNIETGESADGPDFRYRVPEPIITGIQPSSGTESGGTLVTIQGLNFTSPLRVTFGDQAASVDSVSADGTQIRVRTPIFSGELNTEACGDGGERFVPTAVNVGVENLVTTCTDSFQNGFVYSPSDTTCRNENTGDGGGAGAVQCEDGIDNDGDGDIDFADPECTGPGDDDESA